MYRFLITIEKGDESYGAYAPDLPGCVAVGNSVEEVKERIRVAIEMHLKEMIEDGSLSLQHILPLTTWILHFRIQQDKIVANNRKQPPMR